MAIYVRLTAPARNLAHGDFAIGEVFRLCPGRDGSAYRLSRVTDRAKLSAFDDCFEVCPAPAKGVAK